MSYFCSLPKDSHALQPSCNPHAHARLQASLASSGKSPPGPAFVKNKYAYDFGGLEGCQMGTHVYERSTQHWVLWYFHKAARAAAAVPSDQEIETDVRSAVVKETAAAGFKRADYM
jgi:hypothetical protein